MLSNTTCLHQKIVQQDGIAVHFLRFCDEDNMLSLSSQFPVKFLSRYFAQQDQNFDDKPRRGLRWKDRVIVKRWQADTREVKSGGSRSAGWPVVGSNVAARPPRRAFCVDTHASSRATVPADEATASASTQWMLMDELSTLIKVRLHKGVCSSISSRFHGSSHHLALR